MTESDDTNWDGDEDKSTSFKDEIVRQLKILNVHLERLTKYKEIDLEYRLNIAKDTGKLNLGESLTIDEKMRNAKNIGKNSEQIGNNNK